MKTNVTVYEKILKVNDYLAQANHLLFDTNRVFTLSIIGSPGAGKTLLLEKTVKELLEQNYQCAVLVGDIATTRDAERLYKFGIPAIQLTTGGACHLEAQQIQEAVNDLKLQEIDFLFIENVGNLVCPSSYDLGEHLRIVLTSVPEGDDKIEKYPSTYKKADVVILNKIDYIDKNFNIDKVKKDLGILAPNCHWFELSCYTGTGIDTWINFLIEQKKIRLDK